MFDDSEKTLSTDDMLDELRKVVGDEGMTAAIEMAAEAARMGLSLRDLEPMSRVHSVLSILGIPVLAGESTWSWGRRNGFISQKQAKAAADLDLLGMSDPDHPHEEHR